MNFDNKNLPGLYRSADQISVSNQKVYFYALLLYLILLIFGAFFAFVSNEHEVGYYIGSGAFFLISILALVWLRLVKPSDLWYNGRAVAESVKTRAWRWMMKAEPYHDNENDVSLPRKKFIIDLTTILEQNPILHNKYKLVDSKQEPITTEMTTIRNKSLEDRLEIYRKERIEDQQQWYYKKSRKFIKQSKSWFSVTVGLHLIALLLIGINIYHPELDMPIEVIAVAASSALTWFESKRFNDLSASYTLTVQEIAFIKAEKEIVNTEVEFSEYVINCENAFSREHTQWFARKTN